MSDWQNKPWGTTRSSLSTPGVCVEELRILAGCKCSVHRHRKKDNTFFLISGRLRVDVFPNFTELGPGDSIFVKAGAVHQFHAMTDSHVIEIYTPSIGRIDANDIERLS